MITIKFDDPNLEENVKAIFELQKYGISDKVIQDLYDRDYKKNKEDDTCIE